ncbi:hypothetical protein RAZWK3B_02495 [Roseobacter sp. AzwK-3b]|nr:hypothetical protein RAZWK3B_02495 [Roseobacter sp. AzwK-3b]
MTAHEIEGFGPFRDDGHDDSGIPVRQADTHAAEFGGVQREVQIFLARRALNGGSELRENLPGQFGAMEDVMETAGCVGHVRCGANFGILGRIRDKCLRIAPTVNEWLRHRLNGLCDERMRGLIGKRLRYRQGDLRGDRRLRGLDRIVGRETFFWRDCARIGLRR